MLYFFVKNLDFIYENFEDFENEIIEQASLDASSLSFVIC